MVRGNQKETAMTTPSFPLGRKPTHRLFRVVGDGKNSIWTPIGAAWPNKDGQGFSINCEAMPLSGRIVMRAISEPPAVAG